MVPLSESLQEQFKILRPVFDGGGTEAATGVTVPFVVAVIQINDEAMRARV